jgi:hypothetical protein
VSSPGGDEVGRVSVRVVPDSSGFDDDLRRQLNDLPDFTVNVVPEIDEAKLKAELEKLRNIEVTVPVNFDVENARDDIARATSGAKAKPVKVPVELDEAGFQTEIARVQQELSDLSAQEATPDAKLKSDKLKAELRTLKADLAALSAETVDIKVSDSGITVVQAHLFDLRTTMAALSATPVHIAFEIQEADLKRKIAETEALLAKLDGKKITPELVLEASRASADLLKFRAEADALSKKHIQAVLDLDVKTAGADAEIAAFVARQRLRHKIGLQVEVDNNTLSRLAGSIGQTVTDLFESSTQGLGSAIKGVFGELAAGGKDFFSGLEDGLGGLKGGLAAAAQTAVQLSAVLLQVSAIATAIAFAGAAITAAYGAASAAIGVLPGALLSAGAAAATVALGLNGIKKAAQTIKPEFDALKASVSATFEKGLTPAFQQLATIFPKLQANINGVAQALSITATNMVVFLSSAQGVSMLQGIFDKTKAAILAIQPGLQDIISTLLLLANQKSVFDVLTKAVNDFGTAFKTAVTESIASGDFDAAMRGLSGTLAELSRGFADLVKNGITLFANAAPGLNFALKSITDFFNKFDWTRLGTAVSDVFKGLGQAINDIPQSTIDGITQGFEDFGKAVNGPEFQAGFRALIDLIKQFVQALPGMLSGLSRAAVAVSGFVDVIRGVVALGPGILELFTGQFGKGIMDLTKAFGDAGPLIGQGIAKIAASVQGGGPALSAAMGTVGTNAGAALTQGITTALHPAVPAVQAELSKVQAVVTEQTGKIPPTMIVSLHNADMAIEQGTKNWAASAQSGAAEIPPAVGGEMAKVPPAAETALAPIQQLQALQGMRDQFTLAAADSMHAMSVGVQSGMAEVQQQFKTGLDTASSGVNSSFALIGQGFTVGMAGLAATVASGMPAIQAAFNFQNVGSQVGLAFLGLVGSFTLGMASLAAAVTAGMPAVQAAFNFTNVGTQVGLAFQGLVGTVTLGMQSFAASVTAGMVLVQQAFTTGFSTSLTAAISTGFAGLKVATDAGMLSIIDSIRLGGTLMQATLHVAIGLMATDVTTQFGLVQAATVAGMQGIVDTITASMPVIAQAFDMQALTTTVGIAFQSLVGTFTVGMASIAVAVTSGMATASQSMSAGMAGMAAAATAGMSGVTAAIQAGMAVAIAAIDAAGRLITASAQQSMTGFGTAIQAGMAQAQNTINAATQDMLAKIQNLGTQMATIATQSMLLFANGVRVGMNQSVAAVQDGVNRMIAALRSGTGQFNGIGVQMMQGLRAGILSQAGSIAAAAASVVSGAIAAARAAANVHSPSRVFMEIGSFMAEGLAVGMESAAPRVVKAADTMVGAAVDTADKISAAFSGDSFGSDLSAKIEHSFGDVSSTVSTKDVVGQLRKLNGTADQSSYLAAIVSLLQLIAAQNNGSGSAAAGAQFSRASAELGAF